MDVDEDILPVMERLTTARAGLESAVEAVYSANLSEDSVVETMTLEQQASLATVSAFTIAMALYCHKKANNEPVDSQLMQKIVRIREYDAKVKGAAGHGGLMTKRYQDEKAESESDDEEGALAKKKPTKRLRVDQDAVARLMKL